MIDGNAVKSMIDRKALSDEKYGTHAMEEKDILEVVKRIGVGNPLSDGLEETHALEEKITRNEVKSPFGKKEKSWREKF